MTPNWTKHDGTNCSPLLPNTIIDMESTSGEFSYGVNEKQVLWLYVKDYRLHVASPAEQDVSVDSLDAKLKEAGMLTVSEIMAGTSMDKWIAHAGVTDIDSFENWLVKTRKEFLTMQASRDLTKETNDELYEWILAHTAALTAVHVNFKQAKLPTDQSQEIERLKMQNFDHETAISALTGENTSLQNQVTNLIASEAAWCKGYKELEVMLNERVLPALTVLRNILDQASLLVGISVLDILVADIKAIATKGNES